MERCVVKGAMIIVSKLKGILIAIFILFIGSLGLAQEAQESQNVQTLQIGQQALYQRAFPRGYRSASSLTFTISSPTRTLALVR